MPSILETTITASAPVQASVGVASATIVAQNVNRAGLTMVNISDGTIYLAFDGNTALLGQGIAVNGKGSAWNMEGWSFTKGSIQAIGHSASLLIGIQEFYVNS